MLRRKRFSTAVALAFRVGVLALLLLSRSAYAAETDEALHHYQRGVELFNEGAYDASLLEFERAYKIAPTYKLLYNIGQVNRQLNDYAKALDAFDQYLRDGASEIPAARKSEVRAEMVKLSGRVARLNVRSNGAGELSIDDAPAGRVPIERPLVVNVGRRRVALRDPARGVVARVVDVVAGENVVVDLDFVAPPSVEGGTKEVVLKRSFPVIPWVVTGALGVAAAVTGILALNKQSSAEEAASTPPASANPQITDPNPGVNSAISSERSSAQSLGLVTDVLLGCTIVSGVISGYFTYKYLKQGSGTTPALGVGPASVSLTGSF